MSFVKIKDEKNPIEMHNKVYEAIKSETFSPELCEEVLSHTNVSVIMMDMLKHIEKKPIEEQKQYKDMVIAIFMRRQQNKKVTEKALSIAENNGYRDELIEVIEYTGKGGYPAKSIIKIFELEGKTLTHAFGLEHTTYDCMLEYKDFSDYNFVASFRAFDEISFDNCKNLNGVIDVRDGLDVDFKQCDLSEVEHIHFSNGVNAAFYGISGMAKSIADVRYKKIKFDVCNLGNMEEISFKEGSAVDFLGCPEMPKKMDVSGCDEIKFVECNMNNVNMIIFKNPKQVIESEVLKDYQDKVLTSYGELRANFGIDKIVLKEGSTKELYELLKNGKNKSFIDTSNKDFIR